MRVSKTFSTILKSCDMALNAYEFASENYNNNVLKQSCILKYQPDKHNKSQNKSWTLVING